MEATMSYLITRSGSICKADVELTDAASLSVAESIRNHRELYLARLKKCFDRHGADSTVAVEGIRLQESHPPILSFPSFDVTLGAYRFSNRVTLTVCRYARRSKIWCRSSLFRYEDRPACKLDEDAASGFVNISNGLNRMIVREVFEEYKKTIQAVGVANDLYKRYEFRIQGFNSRDPRIRLAMRGLAELSFVEAGQLLESDDYFDALGPFLRIALKRKQLSKTSVLCLRSNPDFDLSFLGGIAEARSIRSLVLARPSPKITLLDCVCFSKRTRFARGVPADLSTQELVREYACRY